MDDKPRSKDDLILVFDSGTQSIRCGLFDVSGQILDFFKLPIQPYFSDQPGFAEQHCEYFWGKFCEASRELLARNPARISSLVAVTLTTQRGVYINLDADGNPLRPAISWLDQRQADAVRFAPAWLEAALKISGMYAVVEKLFRKGFSNWILQNQPDIWQKTHKYVLLSGFYHQRLSGNYVESMGTNFGYLPIDRKTFAWAKKSDIIWYLFSIEKEKLPEIARQGETIGRITRQAALDTGIPEGLPLIAAACDKSCEVLGAGILESSTGYLSFGTCATVNTVTTKSVDLLPYLPPYPGAVPGTYCTEIPIDRGFWMVSWFKDEFGLQERQEAQKKGLPAESLFDEMIRHVPPGSNGLVLQPYWSPDRVYCDEYGKGSVIGFSDAHTRAHLYRAILEGLVFALKDGARITTGKLKQPLTKLRVSGGGAQSQIAVQIAADVFDLTVECPSISETSALGAAIIAAVGLGYYPDYASAVKGMTSLRATVQPVPSNRDLYARIYDEVYRKQYRRLRPLYKAMAGIAADYPEKMKPPVS